MQWHFRLREHHRRKGRAAGRILTLDGLRLGADRREKLIGAVRMPNGPFLVVGGKVDGAKLPGNTRAKAWRAMADRCSCTLDITATSRGGRCTASHGDGVRVARRNPVLTPYLVSSNGPIVVGVPRPSNALVTGTGSETPVGGADTTEGDAQARTALVSIAAATVLVALKLGTGIISGSLGLVSAGIEVKPRRRRRGAHVLRDSARGPDPRTSSIRMVTAAPRTSPHWARPRSSPAAASSS